MHTQREHFLSYPPLPDKFYGAYPCFIGPEFFLRPGYDTYMFLITQTVLDSLVPFNALNKNTFPPTGQGLFLPHLQDNRISFCTVSFVVGLFWATNIRLTPASDLLSAVKDLIHWRDPKKSGVAFGLSLLMLLSLAAFSVISVASYLLLALLCVTITFRIYKSVVQAVQKSSDGHPFKWDPILLIQFHWPGVILPTLD